MVQSITKKKVYLSTELDKEEKNINFKDMKEKNEIPLWNSVSIFLLKPSKKKENKKEASKEIFWQHSSSDR